MSTIVKICVGIVLIVLSGASIPLVFIYSFWFLIVAPVLFVLGFLLSASHTHNITRGLPRYQCDMEPGKMYDIIYHQRDGGYALLVDKDEEVTFWQLTDSPPGIAFTADDSPERRLKPIIVPFHVCGDS